MANLDTDYGPVPVTPLAWMARQEKRLNARQAELRLYDEYYEGHHALAFASPKFRDAFGNTFREFADNWCDLVVDAVEERLNVEGFRMGADDKVDDKAWRIWQENQLDADSQIAHTEALIFGSCSALVWPEPGMSVPAITVEHPTEMIVTTAAGNRRRRVAAMKRWLDDSGYIFGTLYLPDEIYKFRSAHPIKGNRITTGRTTSWVPRELDDEEWPLVNPFGVVPVVPIVNRPRLLKPGVSEIAKVIPVQNGVNKLIADMLVASEFAAAPQRWATGLEIPKDPVTGQPIEVFKTMLDRLWSTKSTNAQFGAFPVADLANFVKAIEVLVQHIASQTRTPPHYFYLSGSFPSGESIKSAETGLVAKSRRKMRHFGEAWEEVMRLALAASGDRRTARIMTTETVWGDPESRSESEHIDAVIKRKALDIPNEQLWEDAGYSPQQIKAFKAMGSNPGPEGDDEGGDKARQLSIAEMIQKLYLGVDKVITSDEARQILRDAGLKLDGPLPDDVSTAL